MKILIVYPPCRESTTSALPLGLLYVAQPLVDDGHKVKFLDIALEKTGHKDHKVGKIVYYKFLAKHYRIMASYHFGLFGIIWGPS